MWLVTAYCLSSFPHKSSLATHLCITTYISMRHDCPAFVTIFLSHFWPVSRCLWRSVTVTWRLVLKRDIPGVCGENVQWTPAGNITAINKSCHEPSGHAGIFTFSRQEVRAVGETQTRGVLLITPGRSHGHTDSAHSILTNQRPGQWASGQWEDRVQNNWGWFISRCHHSDSGVRSQCSTQHETEQTSRKTQDGHHSPVCFLINDGQSWWQPPLPQPRLGTGQVCAAK